MPLQKGASKKVIGENISELHKGRVYSKTAAKFGINKARKQSLAIALSEARKSKKGN